MPRAVQQPALAAGLAIGLTLGLAARAGAQEGLQTGIDSSLAPAASSAEAPSSGTETQDLIPTAPGAAGNLLPFGLFGAPPAANTVQGSQPADDHAPAFQWTPAISAAESFNSNIYRTGTGQRSDFITQVAPSIAAQGQSPRATLNLNYAPTAQIYAHTGAADGVSQHLVAQSAITLVPQTVFVNLSGFATVQPTNGGIAGVDGIGGLGGTAATGTLPSLSGQTISNGALNSSSLIANGNRTQDFAVSAEPYAVHRFGSVGTATVGLSLSETLQDTTITNPNAVVPGTASAGTQTGTTEQATTQFATGEAFGRVRDVVLAQGSRSQGTGVLSGASADLFADWFGYALNQQVVPFGELGHENLSYNTAQRTHISDVVWELGVQFTPNPDSRIMVGYGHQDGQNAWQGTANYALTARTSLSGRYTSGLTTNLGQIQSTLGLMSFDPNGNAYDAATGSPPLLGGSLLAVQNTLNRATSLSFAITTVWERDTVSLGLQRQTETPIGTAPGATAPGINQSAFNVYASLTHLLDPDTTLGLSVQVGRNTYDEAGASGARTIGLAANLHRQLTQKLSAFASYQFYNEGASLPGQGFSQQVALIGVTRSF